MFSDIPSLEEWKQKSSSFLQRRANKADVVKLDELIEQYHESTPMTRLNLLMLMNDTLAHWASDKVARGVGSGRTAAMQALEAVVLRKLAMQTGWGAHRYHEATCIGYQVQTGEFRQVGGQWIVDYRGRRGGQGTRSMQDSMDVGGRIAVLKRAIETAHQRYTQLSQYTPPDRERRRLKIFMAPEFFFRGGHGAYGIGEVSRVFASMRQLTGEARFEDWLFVFGTVVCATEKESYDSATGAATKIGMMLDNVAPIQKGGYSQSDGLHDHIVTKEFVSHIDYSRALRADPNLPGMALPHASWGDVRHRMIRLNGQVERALPPEGSRDVGTVVPPCKPGLSERAGGGIFTVDGVTFGMEICLDHAKHRLCDAVDRGALQIQLVPSAGMSISDQSIAVVPGGLVFNVDSKHIALRVHQAVSQPGYYESAAPSDPRYFASAGKLWIFEPVRIPWPGQLSTAVGRQLGVHAPAIGGHAPVPPPRS